MRCDELARDELASPTTSTSLPHLPSRPTTIMLHQSSLSSSDTPNPNFSHPDFNIEQDSSLIPLVDVARFEMTEVVSSLGDPQQMLAEPTLELYVPSLASRTNQGKLRSRNGIYQWKILNLETLTKSGISPDWRTSQMPKKLASVANHLSG